MASQPKLTPLPPGGFRRTPWKNGGGVTIDIADAYDETVEPGSWQGMIWRLGRTPILTPGPFSDLTGYDRLQMVIEGSGLVLETPAGEIDLRQPFQVARYDGGTPITSRLENGPVEVVNLIADRSLCAIELAAIGSESGLALTPGRHIIYAPTGPVSGVAGEAPLALDAGHALKIEVSAQTELTIAGGVAVVATIALRPR